MPGQYLGYSLQATRVAHRLLQAPPGWKISLEVFEDVGAEDANGSRIAEQDKSTHGSNPVSDRAVDLWKTLAGWFRAVERGDLDSEHTEFVIYVSEEKTGAFLRNFVKASNEKEAFKALKLARDELWGSHPKYEFKPKIAANLSPHLDTVFGVTTSGGQSLARIICNFSVLYGSGSPQTDFLDYLKRQPIIGDIAEDVAYHILGWVKSRTDTLLERGQSAIIDRNEFHQNLTAYVKRRLTQVLLCSISPAPNSADVADHVRAEHRYIKQLDLIECEDDDKISAARCYLQAATDRTAWSEKGLLHEEDFNDLEVELKNIWRNHKRKAHALVQDELAQGKILFSDCCNYSVRIQGSEVPRQFTEGSLHALTDDPTSQVGWHPRFQQLLDVETYGDIDPILSEPTKPEVETDSPNDETDVQTDRGGTGVENMHEGKCQETFMPETSVPTKSTLPKIATGGTPS